mmetsp:Transcript_5172/g.15772  ORF Transcript_5172/g.15772 Transcript_5172/m.15772 type:complete len:202 (-) Transcript_5172:1311-1916(-)
MSRLGLSRRFTYGPYTIFNILIHPRMHLSSMAAVQTKTNKSFRGIKMAHLECSFISPPEPDKGKPVRPMVARLVGPHALMALNRSRRPLRVGRDGRKEVGLFVKGSSHFFGHLAICRIGNDRLDRKGSQSFRDRHRAHGRRAAPRKGNGIRRASTLCVDVDAADNSREGVHQRRCALGARGEDGSLLAVPGVFGSANDVRK